MAEWLGWYGHGIEGHPDIEVGEGSVEDIVSHHKDVHKAIKRHGMPILHRAEVGLAAHHKSGGMQISWMYTNFAGGEGLNSTKLDYYVVMHDTDPRAAAGSKNTEGQGKGKSVLSFEYGHRNSRTGERVEGAWILHDAAGLGHGK